MDIRKIEWKLVEAYKYKKLPDNLSDIYRKYFRDNIPRWLCESGEDVALYTLEGSTICDSYDRIVIGDYGAFIEFSKPHDCSQFIVAPGEEYRVNNEKYSKNVKYILLTINDRSLIKIYYQKKSVAYADYLPGKYYVSIHDVKSDKSLQCIDDDKQCIDDIGCKYCKPIIECMPGLTEEVPMVKNSYYQKLYLFCSNSISGKNVCVITENKLDGKSMRSMRFPIEYCPMCGLKIGDKQEKFIPAFEYTWD